MSLGIRHWSRRRKAKLKGFPTRESVMKNALDVLMYPVAIASPLAMVPQVLQIFVTRDASSLSLSTWAIFAALNVVWILYARVHRETPVLVTNVMMVILNSAVVVGIILYH